MKHSSLCLIAVLLGGLGMTLNAHHRQAEVYAEQRAVTVAGRVAEWHYREPHCFVILEVRNARDQVERWIVEGPGASEWRRRGVGPEILRLGDRVTVTGHPGRVPAENRVLAKQIVRSDDGWRWPAATR